jgi:hypothetical protein
MLPGFFMGSYCRVEAGSTLYGSYRIVEAIFTVWLIIAGKHTSPKKD